MTRQSAPRSNLVLLLALAAGAAFGAVIPFRLTWLHAAGHAYLNILNMVALPLIVLAVWAALRQWRAWRGMARRLAWLPVAALVAMAVSALLGAVLAHLTLSGRGLDPQDAQALGRLALRAEPALSLDLVRSDADIPNAWGWDPLVTDNAYRALAYGTLASALVGIVLFGLGLAAQGSERSRAYLALADGVYRSLETLVERVSRWLPFFAFALAAATMNSVDRDLLLRMQGFLLPFLLAGLGGVALAVLAVSAQLRQPVWRVLSALRAPLVVGLFSGGPAATVPGLIDALCNQLGLRRDLMELAVPVLPAFLRLGDAVFFAVLAVFVSHLYGQSPGAPQLLVLAAAATAAALAGVAWAGGWTLAGAGLLLAWLDLPFEALMPAFVLLEAVTAGVRTLLSVMAVAPLLALLAPGLASPAPRAAETQHPALGLRYAVALPPRRALGLVMLLLLALLMAGLAGVGVGLRGGGAWTGGGP